MAFDGTGRGYQSGPSWGCAILIVVVLLVVVVAVMSGLILLPF